MLVLRIQRIWLFPQQDRGLAVQVSQDQGGSTVTYCCCSFLWNTLTFTVLKLPTFPSWNLTERFFVMKVVDGLIPFHEMAEVNVNFVSCCKVFIRLQQRDTEKSILNDFIL